jgi:hypothetical protein
VRFFSLRLPRPNLTRTGKVGAASKFSADWVLQAVSLFWKAMSQFRADTDANLRPDYYFQVIRFHLFHLV